MITISVQNIATGEELGEEENKKLDVNQRLAYELCRNGKRLFHLLQEGEEGEIEDAFDEIQSIHTELRKSVYGDAV